MKKGQAPDPRFDPRFQRGYDGPEPTPPSTAGVPSPVTRVPGAFERPAASNGPLVAGPLVAGPLVTESPATEPVADEGTVDPSSHADPTASDAEAFWVPPRRNPFALVLLVGGVVMIASGAWLIWTLVTASSYPNGYDRGAQAFALVQQQATPALLICGLLGIVGWLVLGALAASDRQRG